MTVVDYNRSLKGRLTVIKIFSQIITNENISLALQKIKRNRGANTPGIDKQTFKTLSLKYGNSLIEHIRNLILDYKPKPTLRKYIPKVNGKMRPLGIPCIEDRIVQQCILQVIEPICESRFHKHSYGFRPNRSAENAIARLSNLTGGKGQLRYAVTMDIEGFFDNVNHTKLLKQLWHIGIQDRTIIKLISKILKAGVYECGKIVRTNSGTPQGGVLSPLLANVVLNELDWFVSKQWETPNLNHSRSKNVTSARRSLKHTKRIEQWIVRYADDFVILCRTKFGARKVYEHTKKFIENRLYLKINQDKSSIVNLAKHSINFLGFSYKLVKQVKKYVGVSHISEKALKSIRAKTKKAIKSLYKNKNEHQAVKYNSVIRGIINYYSIASMVNKDLSNIYKSMIVGLKKLTRGSKPRYDKTSSYRKLYPGLNYRVYWVGNVCLYPLTTKFRIPKNFSYEKINDIIAKNISILFNEICDEWSYLRYLVYKRDKGICKYTNKEVMLDDFDVHHVVPRHLGGEDVLNNLVTISRGYHQSHYKDLHC